jgi:hypothetical protein
VPPKPETNQRPGSGGGGGGESSWCGDTVAVLKSNEEPRPGPKQKLKKHMSSTEEIK